MTGEGSEAWSQVASAVAILAAAGFLSSLRLTIARASRPAVPPARPAGFRRLPSLRSRVLGALLIGAILLNSTVVVLVTRLADGWSAGNDLAAIAASFVGIVAVEALARAAVARGWIARGLAAIGLRVEEYGRRLSASEELRGQVDLLHQSGGVVKEERDMLGGLLDLKELTVSAVMVHRTKMRSVDASLSPADLIREVLQSPYTRLPVWRDDPENIVGVLHARDLLRAAGPRLDGSGSPPLDPERIASVPWFVPDTTTLRDQLGAFLSRKQHVALVVDEYGALMGLVTLEDILEEIVGEISDEHDVVARGIRVQPDGSVLVDGSVPIRDLNRTMDWSLPDDEATTVAGLVIHEAMAIPDPGQVFNFHGFRFEVLRRARNRVAALRVGRAGETGGRRAEPGVASPHGPARTDEPLTAR